MPYIELVRRKELHKMTFSELMGTQLTVGDINYLFSCLLWTKFRKEQSYAVLNGIVGVLECVKLEFYRRQAVPYEKTKITENGDIKFHNRENYEANFAGTTNADQT